VYTQSGADTQVCPGGRVYTQSGADTQVCPYRTPNCKPR